MTDCIFCKIVRGDIPAKRVYEDDIMIVIEDIAPQARLHFLIIPKTHYANIGQLAQLDGALLSKCVAKFDEISEKLGFNNGYRLVTNKGADARQSVNHIHIHALGGEMLSEKMGV